MSRAARIAAALRRRRAFLRGTDGSSTVEFVICVPVLMVFLLSGIELGLLMTRGVLIDRAVEMAVREVRIGALAPVTHDTLRDRVCELMPIMENCQADLRLEMQTLNPRAAITITREADCVDRGDPEKPLRSTFDQLNSNQITIVRACALFDPLFPTTGLAASLHKESENAYALVSNSLFVVEPRE
ncbi:TadE/TadG family type IV pilus assembly protein [Wenxinia marina]|uniref:TadE-like protein n=1 Tax=Wenxinia marina DSM 24838 TaxID=1123501 RepID=A0A0D0Q7B0_9RHOB|nr:TadE family protein [Wenxinia marina]KIQ68357.1 TadE-like protein [Wenxinia marina DSM 24838]GGL72825.1 hypothetical protein GCM10011392_29320 [Wenxinia marina]